MVIRVKTLEQIKPISKGKGVRFVEGMHFLCGQVVSAEMYEGYYFVGGFAFPPDWVEIMPTA